MLKRGQKVVSVTAEDYSNVQDLHLTDFVTWVFPEIMQEDRREQKKFLVDFVEHCRKNCGGYPEGCSCPEDVIESKKWTAWPFDPFWETVKDFQNRLKESVTVQQPS